MRVKMLTTSAGPAGHKLEGQEYDVTPTEGKAMIDSGTAILVTASEVAAEKAVERATKSRATAAKKAAAPGATQAPKGTSKSKKK
jgi:hypothetical protein